MSTTTKITIVPRTNTHKFRDVQLLDVFKYAGNLYIKIGLSGQSHNVVSLGSKSRDTFTEHADVEILQSELIVKE